MGEIDQTAGARARGRPLERGRPAVIEVPGPGQESVWDYPRPPRVEPVGRRVIVEFGGVAVADSRSALRVIETASPPVYYIPAADVRVEHLEPHASRTFCEWKGEARYWSVRVGERFAERAAWSYPRPDPGFEAIAGHYAFFAGRMDACRVGAHVATPQPGAFYGGWITPDLTGPFKGAPGTGGW